MPQLGSWKLELRNRNALVNQTPMIWSCIHSLCADTEGWIRERWDAVRLRRSVGFEAASDKKHMTITLRFQCEWSKKNVGSDSESKVPGCGTRSSTCVEERSWSRSGRAGFRVGAPFQVLFADGTRGWAVAMDGSAEVDY